MDYCCGGTLQNQVCLSCARRHVSTLVLFGGRCSCSQLRFLGWLLFLLFGLSVFCSRLPFTFLLYRSLLPSTGYRMGLRGTTIVRWRTCSQTSPLLSPTCTNMVCQSKCQLSSFAGWEIELFLLLCFEEGFVIFRFSSVVAVSSYITSCNSAVVFSNCSQRLEAGQHSVGRA